MAETHSKVSIQRPVGLKSSKTLGARIDADSCRKVAAVLCISPLRTKNSADRGAALIITRIRGLLWRVCTYSGTLWPLVSRHDRRLSAGIRCLLTSIDKRCPRSTTASKNLRLLRRQMMRRRTTLLSPML